MKSKIAFTVAAVMSTAIVIGLADTHAAEVVAAGGPPGDTSGDHKPSMNQNITTEESGHVDDNQLCGTRRGYFSGRFFQRRIVAIEGCVYPGGSDTPPSTLRDRMEFVVSSPATYGGGRPVR